MKNLPTFNQYTAFGRWLAAMLVLALLPACSSRSDQVSQKLTASSTPPPIEYTPAAVISEVAANLTSTATVTLQPEPTQTSTTFVQPGPPRQGEMEAYGFVFNAQATPRIPPGYSVSMPIWGVDLPRRTIDGEPRFVLPQPPARVAEPPDLLAQAGCQGGRNGSDVTCPPESPLAAFGCESFGLPVGVYPELGVDRHLVATCYSVPPDDDQPRQEYLFRRGCAFRRNASHIFRAGEQYIKISTPEQLKEFFTVLESPEVLLAYAQLATGLQARFDFAYDPHMLYFQEVIEGTRVTRSDQGYLINLFQSVTCSCEPWVSSEVQVMVDSSGEVTWLSAWPIWMTTGFSCAD